MAIQPPSNKENHTIKSHYLSAAATASIAVGGSIALAFLLLAIYLLARKRSAMRAIKLEQERAELDMNARKGYEMDGTPLRQELDNTVHHGAELDGRIHIGYELEGSGDWIAEAPAQENAAKRL